MIELLQFAMSQTTLKRISNWPPSYFHILLKVFGESTNNQILV